MKCPNCGNDFVEGHLYCDVCGEEIRIVPDFEPEIENSILENLSGIVEDFESGEAEEFPEEMHLNKKQTGRSGKFSDILSHPGKKWIVIAFAVVILGVTGILFFQNNSYNFQVKKAKQSADVGDYTQAISYMDRAIDLNDKDIAAKLLISDYYCENGQTEKAEIILREIISLDASNLDAYRKLIAIYEADSDYERINKILIENGTESVLHEFSGYVALPPEFSYEAGNYDEVVPLKLSSNTTGIIYYTLDGTTPDEKSDVYTSPIFLENGYYHISAIFVNDKGVMSECAENTYTVHVTVPLEPDISAESGIYTIPTLIEAEIPIGCSVYYTVDGTEPTQNSIPYMMPISMPIGDSTFKFVAYSPEGIGGAVATREYTLNVETLLTVESAVSLLLKGLTDRGIILDFEGSVPSMSGHNSYISSTLISSGTRVYYLIVEYYVDATGTISKTGNMYAVDADSGVLHKATVDAGGNYTVTPI